MKSDKFTRAGRDDPRVKLSFLYWLHGTQKAELEYLPTHKIKHFSGVDVYLIKSYWWKGEFIDAFNSIIIFKTSLKCKSDVTAISSSP